MVRMKGTREKKCKNDYEVERKEEDPAKQLILSLSKEPEMLSGREEKDVSPVEEAPNRHRSQRRRWRLS